MMKQNNTVVNTLIGIHTLEFIHIIKEMEHLDGPYVEQQDEDNECLRLINDSFHFWAGYFLWARSCAKRLVCFISPNRKRSYGYPQAQQTKVWCRKDMSPAPTHMALEKCSWVLSPGCLLQSPSL